MRRSTSTALSPALAESLAQNELIYSTSRAASGQLTVNHNGRQTTNAVLFNTAGDLVPMHVMNTDFMLRAREHFESIDRFLTRCATSAEDLDFVFHNCASPFLSSFLAKSPAQASQAADGQYFPSSDPACSLNPVPTYGVKGQNS